LAAACCANVVVVAVVVVEVGGGTGGGLFKFGLEPVLELRREATDGLLLLRSVLLLPVALVLGLLRLSRGGTADANGL
jgi:hypothetical protein